MPRTTEDRNGAGQSLRLRFLIETTLARLLEDEGPFAVGDVVLFGKYKNKKGRVVAFGTNHKGQSTVEIEPIPKGRKQNKVLGLYKIWTVPPPEPDEEAAPMRTRRRKAGSGQRKMTKICPTGMNMKGGRCVRVTAGKRADTRRKKKRWGRTGGATKSKKKSARMKRRYSSITSLGNLISEARSFLDNS